MKDIVVYFSGWCAMPADEVNMVNVDTGEVRKASEADTSNGAWVLENFDDVYGDAGDGELDELYFEFEESE